MAVPKHRKTKSKRDQRRMHDFLENPPLTDCPTCGEKKRKHHMCQNCGHYKGEQVVDVLEEEIEEEVEQEEEGRSDGPLSMEGLST